MPKVMESALMRSIAGGVILLVSIFLASSATAAETALVKRGREIYLQNCVACHGLTGSGDGPLAHLLTTPPTNLRLLSELYGNPLPEDRIARAIDGRAEVKAHGPRDMPVWGERFYSETPGGERHVKARIAALVAYLQSIQSRIRRASAK